MASALRNVFTVRSLQENLKRGLGAGVIIDHGNTNLRSIAVTVGGPFCPARVAAATFCVNEMPRLFAAQSGSSSISFITNESAEAYSQMVLGYADGTTRQIEIARPGATSTSLYAKLMQEIGVNADDT